MNFLSEVDWQDIGRFLLAVLPATAALAGLLRGPGAVRSKLRHDADLLGKLPEGSEARSKFEGYLSDQVDRFMRYETDSSRDIQGLVIAGFLVLGFGVLALWLFSLPDWYWWILGTGVAVFALAGLSSMFEDAQKVPRDEKRKRL